MQHVNLGTSGLKVSRLILGAMGMGGRGWREWVLEEAESVEILKRAVDHGITTFDTCDFYSAGESERILGGFVKDNLARDEVVIATKFGMPLRGDPNGRGYSRKYIKSAVEASLKRLQTDYIDLYQTHIWDRSANIEELVLALDELVSEGKILYAGATDMPGWQFSKALYTADLKGCRRLVSMQNHYNLIFREDERELIPLCHDQGIGWIPYSPMGRGFLCGTRTRQDWGTTARSKSDDFAQGLYFREADFAVAGAVEKVAAQRDVEPAQVALAWVMGRPGLAAPVIGATRPEQVDKAVAALDIKLTDEEAATLEAGYGVRPNR
ncbi:MAG: aldo/keto reductase [Pseudomonadota bacterium]